ncbi:hypothetical protein NY08_952 [Rhodococcus sp. B7740]|nr:hypothetical protein NY08_952 [Rhodococcus sp. B7740]
MTLRFERLDAHYLLPNDCGVRSTVVAIHRDVSTRSSCP